MSNRKYWRTDEQLAEIRRLAPTHSNTQITLALLEEQLLNIIKYDPAELVDEEGRFLLLNEIPEDVRSAVAQYEPSTTGPKVKVYSKLSAIALAMKLKGWENPGSDEDEVCDEEAIADALNELNMPQLAAMLSGKLEEEF